DSELRCLLLAHRELPAHLLPHQILLYLPRDRHRELLHEADVLRHLVVRNLLATERADRLGIAALARLQLDPRAHHFAVAAVRHAEHLHVLDLRVAIQELLDLARRDVFAAADDQVLHAADDIAVAGCIERRQIAGVHPTLRVDGLPGLVFVVPVAVHHAVAARQQLAPLTERRDAAFRVDDLHFEMRMNGAYGRNALLQRIVTVALEADRARFRHAVADRDFL